MKKSISFFSLIFLCSYIQAQVTEGNFSFNKLDRPAIVGEFDFSPEVVKGVIFEDLKYNGFLKSSDTKGFKMFPEILFEQLSKEKIDLYLKVDEVKKQKEKSIVYLMISKGNENFISGSSDPEVFTAGITYLRELKPKFEARQLEFDIADQEAVIKKAEKTYNSLVGSGESLLSKKKDIEENIVKNNKAQLDQKAVLEKERLLLENLKRRQK